MTADAPLRSVILILPRATPCAAVEVAQAHRRIDVPAEAEGERAAAERLIASGHAAAEGVVRLRQPGGHELILAERGG